MIKHNGMKFVAAPRRKSNSCKGCYWYPTKNVIFRETYMIYSKPRSIPTYLLIMKKLISFKWLFKNA